MPTKPKSICIICGAKCESGALCSTHRKENAKQAHPYYHSSFWRKNRSFFLKRNPVCVHCKEKGRAEPATVVDHIKPWKTGLTENERIKMFKNQNNWQPLCASCHSTKTRKE